MVKISRRMDWFTIAFGGIGSRDLDEGNFNKVVLDKRANRTSCTFMDCAGFAAWRTGVNA